MPAVRVALLQQMPIFGAIREDALLFLLEQSREVRIGAGEYFFRERDPADCMYVLEIGAVAVLKQWQGQEMLVRRFGPGDCFGELAMLDLFPRSASVRAEADCTAIELTPAQLLRLFERDPEQFALVQMNIGRELCRRMRETDEQMFRMRMGDQAPEDSHVFRST